VFPSPFGGEEVKEEGKDGRKKKGTPFFLSLPSGGQGYS